MSDQEISGDVWDRFSEYQKDVVKKLRKVERNTDVPDNMIDLLILCELRAIRLLLMDQQGISPMTIEPLPDIDEFG